MLSWTECSCPTPPPRIHMLLGEALGGARIGASGESRALGARFVPLEDAWESPLGRPGGAASPGTGDRAAGSVTSGSRAPRLHSCGEEFLLLTLPSLLCSATTARAAKAALSPGPGSAFGVLERVQQCRPAQRGGAGRGRQARTAWGCGEGPPLLPVSHVASADCALRPLPTRRKRPR